MGMKFYEIASKYQDILAMTDETGGEITPEIQAMLDEIEDKAEDKAASICAMVRQFSADEKAYAEERDRLATAARAAKNRGDGLKAYLKRQMEAMGKDKLKAGVFSITLQKASMPTIRWVGEGEIPAPFARVSVDLDYEAARQAEKFGPLPEGFAVSRTVFAMIR